MITKPDSLKPGFSRKQYRITGTAILDDDQAKSIDTITEANDPGAAIAKVQEEIAGFVRWDWSLTAISVYDDRFREWAGWVNL